MFTGLIEAVGAVRGRQPAGAGSRLEIDVDGRLVQARGRTRVVEQNRHLAVTFDASHGFNHNSF